MATGNRFQVIDKQTYLGQECENVYFYRQITGVTVAAPNLSAAFIDTLLPKIVYVQNHQVTHTEIVVNNVDSLADYIENGLTADNVGLVGGDGLPPYACWAFRLNRATRAVRNG